MPQIIFPALLGYALIGVLIAGTDQLYAHLFAHTNYQLALVTDTIYSFIGGWLCGRIAKHDSRSAWGMIIIGEVMGVASTVYLWNTAPHYYSFYLLVMYPIAVWFGARQRKPAES